MTLTEAFSAALVADDPADGLNVDLYGWLIGTWDTVIHDFDDPAQPPRTSRGEWIFVRTLLGHSIQDVFIVPSREARAAGDWGEANTRYGLTHRQSIRYDANPLPLARWVSRERRVGINNSLRGDAARIRIAVAPARTVRHLIALWNTA